MIVTWKPIRSDTIVDYRQPEPDKLQINDYILDFTDTNIVQYNVPEDFVDYIMKAIRDPSGTLHLTLLSYYSEEEKQYWEPEASIPTEVDYGESEVIDWRP